MTGLLAALLTGAAAQIQFNATYIKMPACGEQNSTCPYVYSEYAQAARAECDADRTCVGIAIETAGRYSSSVKEHYYVKYTDPWCVDCDQACFAHTCDKGCIANRGWKHFVGKVRYYWLYTDAVCRMRLGASDWEVIKFDLYVLRADDASYSGCDPARPDVCMARGAFASRYRCYDAGFGECRNMGPEDCARQGMVYCEAPVTDPPTATPYPMAGRQPCVDHSTERKCYEDDQCEWHPGYCTVKKWDICSSPDKVTCVQEQYTNERGATESCYWLWYASKCGRQPCTSHFEDGCRSDPYICEWDDKVGCKAQPDGYFFNPSNFFPTLVQMAACGELRSTCPHVYSEYVAAAQAECNADHTCVGIAVRKHDWDKDSYEKSPTYVNVRVKFVAYSYLKYTDAVWVGNPPFRTLCVDSQKCDTACFAGTCGDGCIAGAVKKDSVGMPHTFVKYTDAVCDWLVPTSDKFDLYVKASDESGPSAINDGSWKWVALALVAVLLLLAGISLGWCIKGRCTMTTAVKDGVEDTDCEYTIFEGVPIEKAN